MTIRVSRVVKAWPVTAEIAADFDVTNGGKAMERIGGHEGMTVYRTAEGVRKVATTDEAWIGLLQEWAMLQLVGGPSAPVQLRSDLKAQWTEQFDHRDSLAIVPARATDDTDAFLADCINFLRDIRHRAQVRHGDLTPPNLSYRESMGLTAFDWQESHLLDDVAPPKRTTSDSWQLMDTYANLTHDPRRIARRWMAILEDLGADGLEPMPLKGQMFLDLGCYEGWFPGLAAAEGMDALGIDENPISIQNAGDMFGSVAQFQQVEIVRWVTEVFYGVGRHFDVVTFLSTWPYLVALAGWNTAVETLRDVIAHSGVMYFETQLYGDGPGPADHTREDKEGNLVVMNKLRTKMDVAALLSQCGGRVVTELLDLTIEGRDATRTLWSVR